MTTPVTLMTAVIAHTDGYRQEYASAYNDHTPREAYDYMFAVLDSTGMRPVGDPDTLTITTHTPTAQVTRHFSGGGE